MSDKPDIDRKPSRLDPIRRYRHDALFHSLVEIALAYRACGMTPRLIVPITNEALMTALQWRERKARWSAIAKHLKRHPLDLDEPGENE